MPTEKVNGAQFHGRYYPVERVCLAVDDDKLTGSLRGPARRDEVLRATGNRFEDLYDHPGVVIGCGWQSRDAGDDPAVQFRFDAAIATERRTGGPACEPEQSTMRTATVKISRYTSRQWTDTASAGDFITDDNLSIACNVGVPEAALLPAASKATRQECLHLIDRLDRQASALLESLVKALLAWNSQRPCRIGTKRADRIADTAAAVATTNAAV